VSGPSGRLGTGRRGRGGLTPWGAEIGREPYQRGFHVVKETRPRPRARAAASDEHIVAPGPSFQWHGGPRRLAQAALGSISLDRAADPPGGGEAHPDHRRAVRAIARLHQNRTTPTGVRLRRGEKVGALLEMFEAWGGFGQAETSLVE